MDKTVWDDTGGPGEYRDQEQQGGDKVTKGKKKKEKGSNVDDNKTIRYI